MEGSIGKVLLYFGTGEGRGATIQVSAEGSQEYRDDSTTDQSVHQTRSTAGRVGHV